MIISIRKAGSFCATNPLFQPPLKRIDTILGHEREGLRLNFGLAVHRRSYTAASSRPAAGGAGVRGGSSGGGRSRGVASVTNAGQQKSTVHSFRCSNYGVSFEACVLHARGRLSRHCAGVLAEIGIRFVQRRKLLSERYTTIVVEGFTLFRVRVICFVDTAKATCGGEASGAGHLQGTVLHGATAKDCPTLVTKPEDLTRNLGRRCESNSHVCCGTFALYVTW